MKSVATFAVVVGLVSALTLFAAPKTDKSNVIYAKAYEVGDLPVWRTNSKETQFAPQVLIKYLESTVDPQSWKNGAGIRIDQKRAILVISQTQANHESISQALKSFRVNDPREVEESATR